jgi:hypothetical protein
LCFFAAAALVGVAVHVFKNIKSAAWRSLSWI